MRKSKIIVSLVIEPILFTISYCSGIQYMRQTLNREVDHITKASPKRDMKCTAALSPKTRYHTHTHTYKPPQKQRSH